MTMHSNLATGRWAEMSLVEQMGNLGSEVGRAMKSKQQGNAERKENALKRAFELLDLIIADQRWRKRLKEIVRLREVLADFFYCDNIYNTSFESLDKYFYYFAYAARNK